MGAGNFLVVFSPEQGISNQEQGIWRGGDQDNKAVNPLSL